MLAVMSEHRSALRSIATVILLLIVWLLGAVVFEADTVEAH